MCKTQIADTRHFIYFHAIYILRRPCSPGKRRQSRSLKSVMHECVKVIEVHATSESDTHRLDSYGLCYTTHGTAMRHMICRNGKVGAVA